MVAHPAKMRFGSNWRKKYFNNFNELNGAPGKIRTPDPLIRSQVLYPAELPAPIGNANQIGNELKS